MSWADGNTASKTVTLPILADILEEPPETFTMVLAGANLGTPSTATVTITNQPNGVIQFAAADYAVNEADGTVTLEIVRVGGSAGALTATIQTVDGTATINDDYAGIPSPLALSWADGNTASKTVTLPILADILEEPPETFTMVLAGADLGTPSTATVTITNQPNGVIQFAAADYAVNEADGTVTLEIVRVGGSAGALTATIQTVDGTATINDDYAGIPSPLALSWADGNTASKTVTLPILADILEEPPETFTMVLAGANLGTPSTATVTITNQPNGVIQFAAADYAVNEADGTVTLEIVRVGGSAGALTATIQTVDGTATINDDYAGIPSPLALSWADGNTASKTVTLPIFADGIDEPDEIFTMVLAGANLGTPSTATVTIAGNLPTPTPTPTPVPTPTPTPVPTPIPTPTPAVTPGPTSTPVPTVGPTPQPTTDPVAVGPLGTQPRPLAYTGTTTGIPLLIAVLLVAAGSALVAFSRHRSARFRPEL